MNNRIRTLEEMKDSRMMFDKNPPTFGFFLILSVSGFLLAAAVFSIYVPKKYIIQASGTVTSTDANYVMCTYTGEVAESNLTEGIIVAKGDVLFTIQSTDYNLQEEQLLKSKANYETTMQKYSLLADSIRDDVNYFDASDTEDDLYYSTFEAYKAQVAQNQLDTSTYKTYGYTDEQIDAELEKNQGKIAEIYYNALQSAENAKNEAQKQVESIDAQLAAISSGKDAYTVTATASGVLHLLADYKPGMVVQTGTTVATITPENSKRILESYVSTSDMARMHVGDKVQVVVDGLSQSVYGALKGTVSSIDSNLTTQQGSDGSTQNVFRVLVELENDYLISRSGEKVDLSNGMTASARIQYDKVTWFMYVMEKLGFVAR